MNDAISPIYQGQFGEFTITEGDRREVMIYRAGLALAGLSFGLGTLLLLTQTPSPLLWQSLTLLFALFSIGLGVSLWYIHIYLKLLHRVLQLFWAIGSLTALGIMLRWSEPLPVAIAHHPPLLIGIGFSFAALTGIFFKEAFCFNRPETKLLTPLIPILILGHLLTLLTPTLEQILLGVWAVLFLIFIGRKMIQPIPPDLGDKSVFAELHRQAQQAR